MNPKAGKSNLKIITIGVLALLISWCLLQVPAWRDQWLYQFYQNQQTLNLIQTANDINPYVTKNHSLSSHLIFQDVLLKAGAKERLIAQYKQTADEYPNDANVLAYYARVASEPGLKQSLLKKAAEINPAEPAVILLQGEQELDTGHPLEALQIISSLDNSHWYKHALRAQAWYQVGNVDEAHKAYKSALQCDGVPVQTVLMFADFLVENEIAGEDNPFALWSEDEKIKEPLAFAYDAYLNGNPVAQIENNLENTVEYHPKALLILARAALKQNEIHFAEKWLNRASRFDADHLDINIYRGITALKQGNGVLAAKLLQTEILSENKLSESEHARIALVLWNAGQTEYAMKHFQHAGALVPAFPGIAIALTEYYLAQNDCKTASALIHKNVDVFANETEKAFAIAAKTESCGELETAAELYGAVLDHNYHNMDARVHLADVYVKRGEKDRAILLYDGYYKSNPNNAFCLAKVAEIHHHFGTIETADQIINYVLGNESKFDDVTYAKELSAKWKSEQSKS